MQADIKGLENLTGDNFKMKIGDTVYTKFGDAKTAFEKVIRDFENSSSEKIGEIGGFKIKARAEVTQKLSGGVLETIGKHVYLTLEKNGSYGVDNSLESIRNFINGNKGTSIVKLLERTQAKLEKSNAELAGLNEQIKQTFNKQEELDAAEKRLAEIQDALKQNKNSQTGDGSTAIINLVDDKNLTEQEKLLQQFGKSMGANVVFFKNENKDFHGAYQGGNIYLNVNSARSITQTVAHELFHFLAANNPELFSEMAKAAGITENQLSNYLAETKRTDVTKTADVTEEMIADSMQEILNRVARKDKSLVERFFAWLQDTFQKFKDLLQNPKGKLTRGQYAKMADVFGKMAVKLTDADGKKIFRYNTRTHNLELANGESLENLITNDDAAGNFEETDEISQKVFEKYLTEGIMQMVRETVEKEIDEHVDFSKMNDPVARDKARDSLPSIRKMLVHYNLGEVQKNEKYKNRLATKIEYARRCFENDERIRNGNVRQMDGNSRQGRISETRTATVSNSNTQGIRGELRGGNVGLSRNVGGEVSGARKHFLKLYDEIQKENRRSEKQGVFNLGKKYSINGETGVANATEFSEQITQQNIEKGRAAVEKVIQTHEDVRTAMNRPDIGDIDILWGYAGDSNRQYRNGYGISHIIARRNLQGLNGEEVARLMPEIIMRGEIVSGRYPNRIELHYDNYIAILSNVMNGENVPHWLLTGFQRNETEPTNQRGEGSDSSAPTTRTPTRSRSTRAANSVSSENIPQTGGNGNIRFSIGSSDNSQNSNSSEGIFIKIKNLLTGRPNLQNERIRKKINSLLSNLAGVKIAAGHMNNGLDIVVKDVEKVIRTNRAYDWQNLLTAVGQKIAVILKLNATPEMGNYIADWLLTGALNNTSTESKNFEKALRDNPEIRENLLEIQNTFAKWRNMTPMEKAQATTEFERPKPTLGEKVKNAKKEGYQQLFEELEPVNNLVKQWEKITGEKLADAVNPYSLLRNYRGIAGRAKLLRLENLKEYATPYDESTCDAMIKDYSGKYGQAPKDLVKFSNAMLTILKNSGVISETAYFNMLREWKNYVPMHRVFDENEEIKFGDSLKKMQGSSRDTVDPLQSIIRNTYDYIRRAEKNEAKLMLASMARTGGWRCSS